MGMPNSLSHSSAFLVKNIYLIHNFYHILHSLVRAKFKSYQGKHKLKTQKLKKSDTQRHQNKHRYRQTHSQTNRYSDRIHTVYIDKREKHTKTCRVRHKNTQRFTQTQTSDTEAR